MLRDLLEAFTKDSLMSTILNEFALMMEDARWMFESVGHTLIDGVDPQQYRQQLYERDIRINKAERSIRKKIIEHLTLSPAKDLGSCLVLFSAAKDAERLGDYCKNLSELAALLHGRPYPQRFAPRIGHLHGAIGALFTSTALAMSEARTEHATTVMETARKLSRDCDQLLVEILDGPDDQDAKAAVATAMTARYLKRVAGHISNIASGVVNPVHKIDFFLEDETPSES